MKNVAHISFEGGGFIIPAHTPYEREMLVEHLEVSTKRHGRIRLDINRRRWTISVNDGAGEVCTSCTRPADHLTYRFDRQSLCRRCARRVLH
jgi:hypothetical protein